MTRVVHDSNHFDWNQNSNQFFDSLNVFESVLLLRTLFVILIQKFQEIQTRIRIGSASQIIIRDSNPKISRNSDKDLNQFLAIRCFFQCF